MFAQFFSNAAAAAVLDAGIAADAANGRINQALIEGLKEFWGIDLPAKPKAAAFVVRGWLSQPSAPAFAKVKGARGAAAELVSALVQLMGTLAAKVKDIPAMPADLPEWSDPVKLAAKQAAISAKRAATKAKKEADKQAAEESAAMVAADEAISGRQASRGDRIAATIALLRSGITVAERDQLLAELESCTILVDGDAATPSAVVDVTASFVAEVEAAAATAIAAIESPALAATRKSMKRQAAMA